MKAGRVWEETGDWFSNARERMERERVDLLAELHRL